MVSVLLCLASFLEILKVRPCCSLCQNFLPFQGRMIFHSMHVCVCACVSDCLILFIHSVCFLHAVVNTILKRFTRKSKAFPCLSCPQRQAPLHVSRSLRENSVFTRVWMLHTPACPFFAQMLLSLLAPRLSPLIIFLGSCLDLFPLWPHSLVTYFSHLRPWTSLAGTVNGEALTVLTLGMHGVSVLGVL